jgi:3-oxoacyl-[acyl-carrier-protein] synthase II
MHDEGPRRISPFAIPMLMSNGAAGLIGIDYGFTGPSFSIASASAPGADGLGMAWMLLRAGIIDVAIAGASDATITKIGVGAFDRLGAMARPEPSPNGDHSTIPAPRPFDRDRDGLVMGEGAAILILEREEYARRRGSPILAELAGYASTADAYHITAPSEDGVGSSQAMLLAAKNACVNLDEINYINAHGTGTPLNDLSETRAIKKAFGELSYKVPVSSTKSMTGHMMGATGALEAVFCTLAIRDKVIPPTINYQTADPECDLDYVPNQARHWPVRIAMSNAFGFGGHNAVLVFREYL